MNYCTYWSGLQVLVLAAFDACSFGDVRFAELRGVFVQEAHVELRDERCERFWGRGVPRRLRKHTAQLYKTPDKLVKFPWYLYGFWNIVTFFFEVWHILRECACPSARLSARKTWLQSYRVVGAATVQVAMAAAQRRITHVRRTVEKSIEFHYMYNETLLREVAAWEQTPIEPL
jgi:hypothetical protein